MPNWLRKQLQQAFYDRNLTKVRILNDCWYKYVTSHSATLYKDNERT